MKTACICLALLLALASSELQQAQPQNASQNRSRRSSSAEGPQTTGRTKTGSAPAETPRDPVARGEYLVTSVAMCIICHSDRDEHGRLIETRLLEGGKIPVPSPYPNQEWGFRAPQIKGLPGWDEREAIRLLVTGQTSTGWSPRPPMPPFRMTEEDAAAVVAYLKSL